MVSCTKLCRAFTNWDAAFFLACCSSCMTWRMVPVRYARLEWKVVFFQVPGCISFTA